jgi:hypothetical protein
MAELKSAIRTMIQAPPQTLWPRTNAGSSDDPAKPFMSLVPQPAVWPQETMKRKMPRITMQPRTPRGTFRFGSSLSSAVGAAASQPEMAKIANTMPRKNAWPLGAFPGLIQWKLIPPGPASAKPEIARASTINVSRIPSTITISVEISIPRYAVSATSTIKKAMNHHHLNVTLYSAFSVACRVSPMNEPTWATTIG